MKLTFTKMHGCANDYIYLDCREADVPANIAELAQKLSRRHFSIGSDGIICICAPETPGADGTMRMFNADGSEGKMCGNGIRCVAEWLRTHVPESAAKNTLEIDTRSGRKTLTYQGEGNWQVDMGTYSVMAADIPALHMGQGRVVGYPLSIYNKVIPVVCVNVGNPHCVVFTGDASIDDLVLTDIGPLFENHRNFPERINTEFVQVKDDTHLNMRVWERGSGETYACGTGACATVAAATEWKLCPRGEDIHVTLRGGELVVRVLPDGHLLMTGPTETVYEGTVEV